MAKDNKRIGDDRRLYNESEWDVAGYEQKVSDLLFRRGYGVISAREQLDLYEQFGRVRIDEVAFGDFSLSRKEVSTLLIGSTKDAFPQADAVIQRIVDMATVPGDIPSIVGAFNRVYNLYGSFFDDEVKAAFQSLVTLARYELEVAAGSYVGSFVLPGAIVEQLPEGRYLEIAIGPGDNLKALAAAKQESTFEGLDISSRMVERARQNLGDTAAIQRGNAMSLQYPNASFDVLVMLNALDRIPNPQVALQEASRVLKQSGTFVVGNCMPLQNTKEVEGGVNIIYVPEGRQVNTMDEAVEKAGCTLDQVVRGIEWNITTIEDGQEILFVDVAVGKRGE